VILFFSPADFALQQHLRLLSDIFSVYTISCHFLWFSIWVVYFGTHAHHFHFGLYITCIFSDVSFVKDSNGRRDGLEAYLEHGPVVLYSVLDDVFFLVGAGIT
jgi:hypothetical protein